jgi:hypothetical protein
MAAVPDLDQGLRSVVGQYKYAWPYALGAGSAKALELPAPGLLAVSRVGFAELIVTPPFFESLPPVVELLSHRDVVETVPRAGWNHAPVERKPPPPRPALLANGFAPGEDDPAPDAFTAEIGRAHV